MIIYNSGNEEDFEGDTRRLLRPTNIHSKNKSQPIVISNSKKHYDQQGFDEVALGAQEEYFKQALQNFDARCSPTGQAIEQLEEFEKILKLNRRNQTQLIQNMFLENRSGVTPGSGQHMLPMISNQGAKQLMSRASTIGLY